MTSPEGFGTLDESMGGEPASVWMRFFARLIDGLILGVAVSVILVPLLIGLFMDDVSSSFVNVGFSASNIIASLIGIAIGLGYYAFFESSRGQTPGKMLLGLTVVAPDGGYPTMEEAIRRNLWTALSIIPILGGLAQFAAAIYIAITINNSAVGSGWHDEFAGGTRVLTTR